MPHNFTSQPPSGNPPRDSPSRSWRQNITLTETKQRLIPPGPGRRSVREGDTTYYSHHSAAIERNPTLLTHAPKQNTWHLLEKGANFTATAMRSAEPRPHKRREHVHAQTGVSQLNACDTAEKVCVRVKKIICVQISVRTVRAASLLETFRTLQSHASAGKSAWITFYWVPGSLLTLMHFAVACFHSFAGVC